MKILEFFGTCGYVLKYLGSELMQSSGSTGGGGGGGGCSGGWSDEDAPRQGHGSGINFSPNVLPPAEHNGWGTMQDYSLHESQDAGPDLTHDWSAGAMDCGGCGSNSWM